MFEAILDAVIDTLKVFVVVYLIYALVELIENKWANKVTKKDKIWSPLFGAGFGLIPQCGFGIVATDMFSKKHITMGTLIAIYIATSDEALPILLSSPDKILTIIPLLVSKFVIALIIGYLVDGIMSRRASAVHVHTETCTTHTPEHHTGCCHHDIEDDEKTHWAKTYLLHPLIHSLKICAYILAFNITFGILIYFIGEDTIINFLNTTSALTPLFSVLVGLIPNCVASVVVTELYVTAGLSFGATLGGLIANAGISYLFLFKQNKNKKENFMVLGIVSLTALVVGYLVHFIF